MPCYHAKPAWQAKLGGALSFQYVRGWRAIMVPCTTCIGCIKAHARAWAFRCHVEGKRHQHTSFLTLTYDPEHCPWTLQYDHFQRFLKSLRQRADDPIRFFMSGEYGSKRKRPHYHAILFGFQSVEARYHAMVQDSWGRGQIQLSPITPARIAYCAGYTDKKAEDRFLSVEHCDPETGEAWQPPFINMSRNPGLGAHARPQYHGPLTKGEFELYKTYAQSWRTHTRHDGATIPVPRYYHQAWRAVATENELERLQRDKDRYRLDRDLSLPRMQAAETIAIARQKASAEARQQKSQKREFQKAEIRRFLTNDQQPLQGPT